MKTLRFTLALLVAVFFASCSTTKVSYKEHSARQSEPVMVNPYIIPTVADLDVSQTKETVTMTFDNELDASSKFNNKEVEAWKETTLAKMMKDFSSDVIIAPVYNITTSEDLKNITVEVSGYPAKYTNFRNITEADSTAMKVHGIELTANGIVNYGRTETVDINTLRETTEYKEKMYRLGSFFAVEAGYNIGENVIDIQGIFGEQYNKYFGFGFGAGILTTNFEGYDKERTISMPIFVNARGYLFDSRVTPYYSVDLGFVLPIKKAKDEPITITDEFSIDGNKSCFKGMTFSPEVGIAFGNLNLGVEYKFLKRHYIEYDYKWDNETKEYNQSKYNDKYSFNALYIKLGYRF